jgi:hypothetical protein
MKAIAILVLAVALETGFLFSAALPAPALARAEAAVKGKVVQLARAALPEPARSSKS